MDPDSDGAVAMGVHEPASANDTATFYADWLDSDAPTYLRVVIDGRPSALGLEYGVDTQGVFAAEVEVEPGDCHAYYFAWETADGATGTFPESRATPTAPTAPTASAGPTSRPVMQGGRPAQAASAPMTSGSSAARRTDAPGPSALALLGVMVLGRRRV